VPAWSDGTPRQGDSATFILRTIAEFDWLPRRALSGEGSTISGCRIARLCAEFVCRRMSPWIDERIAARTMAGERQLPSFVHFERERVA
jgi:hypothetical protein